MSQGEINMQLSRLWSSQGNKKEFCKSPYQVWSQNTNQSKLLWNQRLPYLDMLLKLCLYRGNGLWIYHKTLDLNPFCYM